MLGVGGAYLVLQFPMLVLSIFILDLYLVIDKNPGLEDVRVQITFRNMSEYLNSLFCIHLSPYYLI